MATIVKLNKPISVIDNKMYITELGENIDENNLPEPTANWRTKDIVIGDNLCKFSNINGAYVGHLTTVPYMGKTIFKSNLDNLESGIDMFSNGLVFVDTLSGNSYFPHLDFVSDLPNLKDGTGMFQYRILDKFVKNENGGRVNLSNLEIGDYMFYGSGINTDEIYSIDMPKLKSAVDMFYSWDPPYSGNRIYTGNLESLEDGSGMFYDEYGRSACNEFYGDLPSLKNGYYMNPCNYKFRGSLPSLITGEMMFCSWNSYSGIKLDALSIHDIVTTIPDRIGLENCYNEEYEATEGIIDIYCGCQDTDEDRQLYAQEGGFDSFQEILDSFSAKNWEANLTCAGRPTQTYSLRRTTNENASQLWVKLEEVVIPTDDSKKKKAKYHYTSQDGTKFYNLKIHHFTTGNNEDYDQFSSLEEAVTYFGLKPVER